MIGALIILAALIIVGAVLYLFHRRDIRRGNVVDVNDVAVATDKDMDGGSSCCGMHIVCEKDSLLPEVGEDIEYFDDEELDRYAGRSADGYTDDEIEEFRDVLLTLLPTDIAPWARSIQRRGITLPSPVRDELMMIVAEERAKKGGSLA